ncbi:MAG: hypothetical protein COZ70_03950 [Deltaproteobacteria bacterium CG_4_8_14_3_um_filter_51_11]|nr:caspase family protein [bacterium]OIP40321.1 MAG: hypothetical protein AUK25_07915 [Desulfobacteraceae bacterium CG2_30_51_40]PIP47827.1 MAG: hypothetical protein COX16_03005 [Deltaproteobacteria bacterium CG23_combo_of_CG06-09_8_20_14_all_51_20]PIX20352.1 MAG: hypothetical protein COZ70_03950 [Deltaproteobacteria bacterium CG_4_8_14_3_um_filter_51_11]PIY24567.1 MAG: hypothetical protein COZ11_07285 [Deltaproteobacteria bacterium CG_4_10_14_3_um_filter_51_14]PJB38625.1 MAG: hypothetical pro
MPYKILPSCQKAILGSVLPLLFVLAFCLPAQAAPTKGIQVVIKDRKGNDIGLYKGSYALLIGAARYSGGWPSLTSVTHEMKTVKEALEKAGFVVEMAPDPDAKYLRSAIEGFINRYGYDPENRLLFFFSGLPFAAPRARAPAPAGRAMPLPMSPARKEGLMLALLMTSKTYSSMNLQR